MARRFGQRVLVTSTEFADLVADTGRPRRVLIIVENLPVPFDRRVWQEATTLAANGYTVSVICPKGRGFDKARETIDGIEIFRHPLPLEARGPAGYAVEYSLALFWEFVLTWRVLFARGFDVIQACNPPDTIFLIGGFFKLLGKKFVFDHHDINPELYEAKFGRRGAGHRLMLWLERLTFRTADVSIATNNSFRRIAIERNGMAPERVFVVQSTPDLNKLKRVAPDPALRAGRDIVIGYVGIMGQQDGVDLMLHAAVALLRKRAGASVQFLIIGDGTELQSLKRLAGELGLAERVTFTGYLTGEALLTAFSSIDIGVIPDPRNAYNNQISMNKTFEYMALGIPFVQFDLEESRATAADAALYAMPNEPADMADKLLRLIDDPARREAMAATGRRRAEEEFRWDLSAKQLLAAYDATFAPADRRRPATTGARQERSG